MSTLIKICGITRTEDARAAMGAGAHAIGFIFHPPSARYIAPERAQSIIDELPPFVTAVGVLVNQTVSQVETLLKKVSVNLLQLHGDEPPQLCRSYGYPHIKAIRVRSMAQVGNELDRFPDARGFLLDSLVPDQYGGTGESFQWEHLPDSVTKPIVLAGGLNPQNVCRAIRAVRPYAVDVSSGVELAKGIKDAGKIRSFVEAVRGAEQD